MASLSTTLSPSESMMNMIKLSIEKDIEDGNCKPMEATRRYNNTARTMGLPPATEEIKKQFKNLRATYNAARRRARQAAGVPEQRFVSIRPPRSQRTEPRNTNVPEPPDCGGETKTSEPPMATEVVPIYNEWELDPNIPYAIAVV